MGHSRAFIVVVYHLVSRAASLAVSKEPEDGHTSSPVPGVSQEILEHISKAQIKPPAFTKGSTGCTQDEKDVLIPVQILVSRIVGKVDINATYMPEDAPAYCKFTPTTGSVKRCYMAWGFSDDVAECWAKEKDQQTSECGRACQKNIFTRKGGVKSERCQECLAKIRQTRRRCMWFAMNIGQKCVQCQLEAYDYWDTNCMMICRNAFDQGFSVASPDCRYCNNEHEIKLQECGAL